jgi:outer membrane protein assembly factor BamB
VDQPERIAVRPVTHSVRRSYLHRQRHGEHRHGPRRSDGKAAWQGRLGQATREGFSASPVAFDGKVFFTNDDGDTFVLAAGETFRLLHVNRLGERTLASPALVDGRWYIRTDSHLLAIGR